MVSLKRTLGSSRTPPDPRPSSKKSRQKSHSVPTQASVTSASITSCACSYVGHSGEADNSWYVRNHSNSSRCLRTPMTPMTPMRLGPVETRLPCLQSCRTPPSLHVESPHLAYSLEAAKKTMTHWFLDSGPIIFSSSIITTSLTSAGDRRRLRPAQSIQLSNNTCIRCLS